MNVLSLGQPGVSNYGELNDSFAVAHNRILKSIGKEAFTNQVLSKFPLVLSNEATKEIAYSFGFTDNLLEKPSGKRARAQSAIAGSQHVGLMLTGQAPQPRTTQAVQPQVPVQPGEAVVHQPVGDGANVENGQVLPVHSVPGPPTSATAVPMTPAPLRAPATPAPRGSSATPFTQLLEVAAGPAMAASPAPLANDAPVANPPHESGSASGGVTENAHVEGAPGDGGDGGHQCCICLQPMVPGSITNPLDALPCGHTFHLGCLSRWRETAFISDMTKCPLHPRPSQPVAGNDPQIEPLEESGEDFQIL